MTISILLQPFNLRKHKTDHYKTETGHVHQASQTSLQIQQEKEKNITKKQHSLLVQDHRRPRHPERDWGRWGHLV